MYRRRSICCRLLGLHRLGLANYFSYQHCGCGCFCSFFKTSFLCFTTLYVSTKTIHTNYAIWVSKQIVDSDLCLAFPSLALSLPSSVFLKCLPSSRVGVNLMVWNVMLTVTWQTSYSLSKAEEHLREAGWGAPHKTIFWTMESFFFR